MFERYDVLISNTTIIDGTGKPGFKGSIGIRGAKVADLGDINGDGARVIDGSGLVTCPGFIDPHCHADLNILDYPLAENLIMQGITTFVGGNCGMTLAPIKNPSQFADFMLGYVAGTDLDWRTFGQWLSKVEGVGIAPNYAPLVGHNTVRVAVMGEDFKRKATSAEIGKMGEYVAEAMESGAIGLSSFTDPSPGEYAAIEEIVELAKVAAQYGGLYVPHTRHTQSQWPSDDPEEYGYGIFHGPMEEAWIGRYLGYLEAIEIGKKAAIPVHVAHLGNAYILTQPHDDALEEACAQATVKIFDQARQDGVDITFDVVGASSSISGRRPLINEFLRSRNVALEWLNAYTKEAFVAQLKTTDFRAKIKSVYHAGRIKLGMIHTKADPFWMDCFTILSCETKAYEGKTVGAIARAQATHPLDALFDILVVDPDTVWGQTLDRRHTPAAMPTFVKYPIAMPSTDTSSYPASLPEGSRKPPPTAYGVFPHYFGTYVREKAVLSLEEAVKRATSMPAERFGLTGRGLLQVGAYADIVVFDQARMRMTGDYLDPAQPPDGIAWVMVNGQIVYEGMAHTGAKPGKVLRRK